MWKLPYFNLCDLSLTHRFLSHMFYFHLIVSKSVHFPALLIYHYHHHIYEIVLSVDYKNCWPVDFRLIKPFEFFLFNLGHPINSRNSPGFRKARVFFFSETFQIYDRAPIISIPNIRNIALAFIFRKRRVSGNVSMGVSSLGSALLLCLILAHRLCDPQNVCVNS